MMNSTLINRMARYFVNQPIEKVWIFGSYARLEEDSQSDFDILMIFSPETRITLFKYVNLVNELQELKGKKSIYLRMGSSSHSLFSEQSRKKY